MAAGSGLLRRFFGSAVSNAAGYAVGGAIQPVLEPLTQDITNEAWTTHPVRPIGAAAAARAAAAGVDVPDGAAVEAQRSGLNGDRFQTLVELARDYPDMTTLLDLLRRGTIGEDEYTAAMRRAGMTPAWISRTLALRDYLVPPSDLIRMAVREAFNPAQRDALDLDAEFPQAFADRARLLGISEQSARDYWAAHWNLPSYEQGAQMLFRGDLSPQQFRDLLKAQDYAPVWRDKLANIARAIPTLSDMIRFAVREVYSPADRQRLRLDGDYPEAFTAQAAKHGLSEQDARDYWAAHWRLPSATQGFQMRWRDQLTDAELDGLLKAQDYAPVWRDKLKAITYHVLTRVDVRRMYTAGLIPRDRVERAYLDMGYTPDDAELLTRLADYLKASSTSADPWPNRARSRLYTVTHDEFMDGSVDEATAREMFDRIGIPGDDHDTIVGIWEAERSIARLELTPAQIKKAYTKNRYSLAEALSELRERGMTTEDAETFLAS